MSNIVVIDTETTGFNYSKTDRVIEIAALKYNENFEEVDRFETLLNPSRDLGAQHIHGVDAAWVLDAPKFNDIAEDFLHFVNGSVLVGHNLEFDLNFLAAELGRIGKHAPNFSEHSLDTLRLARSIFGSGQSCKLSDLAALLSFEHREVHSALGDVLATAQLLQNLVSQDLSTSALLSEALTKPLIIELPKLNVVCPRLTRPRLDSQVNSSFITGLVEALPLGGGQGINAVVYIEYLRRAIADAVIDEAEAGDLMAIALDIGLSISDISNIHLEVFSGVTSIAWSDGHLSDFEKSLIDQVARQLGVGEIELEKAKSGKGYLEKSDNLLRQGDVVVLTGTMQPPKDQVAGQIVAFGAEVADSLTKKTNLLVAADPNTLSGKGQRARQLGIPIVSTAQLLRELNA